MPDDELYRAAIAGELRDPARRNAQIDRMLADAKSDALVDDFAYQWLRISQFDRFKPDRTIWPDFYGLDKLGLSEALTAEPLEMFREVLTKNESVLNFLDSNWTMMNNRLADHYGIEGVKQSKFQRVPFVTMQQWEARMRPLASQRPTLGPLHSIGPFQADNFDEAFDTVFAPEEGVDLNATYDELAWTRREEWADGEIHNVFEVGNAAYYIYRTILSPVAQTLTLSLGQDDGCRVWLNGESVLTLKKYGAVVADESRIDIQLREGENQLLIKIVNGGSAGGLYFKAITLPSELIAALSQPESERSSEAQAALEELYLSHEPTASRGGLIGMAGVHKWGSDGIRTKPVERGKYILDVLFNDPPPPPPPNAGEVQPNIRGENLTVRERLEQHRSVAACANCHRRIDPYGLGLENFNVIGKWRTRQDGEKRPRDWGERRPLDITGTMPNGDQYKNYSEFKQLVVNQEDRFLKGLSEKLMVYALARPIEGTDRDAINNVVTESKRNAATLRSMIQSIANTKAFQTKYWNRHSCPLVALTVFVTDRNVRFTVLRMTNL